MKNLVLLILLLTCTALISQNKRLVIKGIVVDEFSFQPITFATILIGDKLSQQAISGSTSLDDGSFLITTDSDDFYVEISFIGFKTLRYDDFKINNGVIDLGVIELGEDSQSLKEVEVRAERSQTEFKLDKRVFNVGKDLSSTGASALEVLNNVPSVNVNIEGDISLRGNSGVQILINGKPSVLASDQGNALGTITAEMIDKIEVITNPSAKYDASGTAGIINIIIKKDDREGINGSITLNTGFPDNHSLGLSLNRRTEKFNLFSQLGYGYRAQPNRQKVINRDLVNNISTFTEGNENRNEEFINVILGTDYHINENNVITLTGHYAYEIEDQPSDIDVRIYDAKNTLTSYWNREEVTEATNPKFQYEFIYKKDFEDNEDHDLLLSATGNLFSKDQSSEFYNTPISGVNPFQNQETDTKFEESKYTFKLDYSKPFNEEWTAEAGINYLINDISNDYSVRDFTRGIWVQDDGLTNVFEYNQKVFGVYGTLAFESDKWGVMFGLRSEATKLNIHLLNDGTKNNQNFNDLFPSFHSSLKITEGISIQAGYSRRINRPGLWSLNPFFNIRNTYSVRKGNPDLQSEYSDSYEITSIFTTGGFSMNMSVYQLFTTDVVEYVSDFQNGINTTSPSNLGTKRSTGIEWNGKVSLNKQITLNGDFNYGYFKRKGSFESTSFDFDADQFRAKLMTKYKASKNLDLETTVQFLSKTRSLQSNSADNLFLDLGVRQKIIKGKGVVNLSIRDLFATNIRERTNIQNDFSTYNYYARGRFVVLGFSYGFGKGEAMEFSGQKRF